MAKKSLETKDSFNICVIGAGHVGLVSAACFAKINHKVICVDSDRKKISLIRKGKLPFFEPGLEGLVEEGLKKRKLYFSSDLPSAVRHSEVIFIAVGTPPRPDGSADLTAVENVASTIAINLNGYKLIVEKSTVPVYTGRKIKETIKRYCKNNVSFDIASNPEFLREGSAIQDFLKPDRIVLGVESKKAEIILKNIYSKIKAPFVITDINTAEIIKHASNSFLATKISFINAISRICDLAGADVEKVSQAMGLDKRIGKDFLNAGIGFGGFCFPKDIEAFIYIAATLGYDFNLLKEVKKINEEQRVYFLNKIREHLWVLKGKKIAVFGLSFKPNTDDMRFSPSLYIVEALVKEQAIPHLYDPQALEESKKMFSSLGEKVKFFKNPYLAVRGCDCLCLLTEWAEFEKLNFKRIKSLMRYPLIADGRNFLDREKLLALGFAYIGVGR